MTKTYEVVFLTQYYVYLVVYEVQESDLENIKKMSLDSLSDAEYMFRDKELLLLFFTSLCIQKLYT